MPRVKRTDLDGMLKLAAHNAAQDGKTRYLYATYYGFTIVKEQWKPQDNYKVSPDGVVSFVPSPYARPQE